MKAFFATVGVIVGIPVGIMIVIFLWAFASALIEGAS